MTSICIYGSQARQRTDQFSDRDVLIVASRPTEADHERQRWEASGWNVSFFTFEHFRRLVNFRSLFVQHLKVEGLIVRDDDEYLRRSLESFQPAKSYIDELKDALLPVNWVSDDEADYWARLCVGDIMFVAIRNAAILHAATNGTHIYDYSQLIGHVVSAFGLTQVQRNALLELRAIKAAYRARRHGIHVGSSLRDAIQAMQLIQSSVLHLQNSTDNRFIPNRYHDLRRAELSLVRANDPRDLDKLDSSDEHFAIWQLMCNPADYPKLRAAPEAALRSCLSENDLSR